MLGDQLVGDLAAALVAEFLEEAADERFVVGRHGDSSDLLTQWSEDPARGPEPHRLNGLFLGDRGNQSVLDRKHRRAGPRAHPDLVVDAGQVVLDGPR
jgi:hypothetical protein